LNPRVELALLVAATAVSRFAFRSRYLYDIDSVNFALAMERFDPRMHQPHPPGYFLYVLTARLINVVVRDPNTALVVMSIAASCGAAAFIAWMSGEWFGPAAARFGGLLFLFSPLAWFHGTVALTYSVEMFFSALLGYLLWRRRLYWGAMMLGIAAGFRPSSLLFLGPLFLFSLRGAPRSRQLFCLAALAGTLAAWTVPMIDASGGFHVWWSSLAALWNAVPGKETVINSPIANSAARLLTIGLIYGLCFGIAALLPLFTRASVPADIAKFVGVWLAPGLLFFTFVFLKFVNSGYLLVLSPPVFAWLGMLAAGWWRRSRVVPAMFCLAANAAIFLFAPLYCSWSSVRKLERQLADTVAALPATVSPEDTLIVGFDSHFMGYRHAGYYLPEYTTVEYPRMRIAEGRRIFTMEHRDTRAMREIDSTRFHRFIVFPLPDDKSSRDYLAGVEAKLGITGEPGHAFVTGPIGALDALFPAGDR
jgi:hypothetical protein